MELQCFMDCKIAIFARDRIIASQNYTVNILKQAWFA